jgi:hypothetical protein
MSTGGGLHQASRWKQQQRKDERVGGRSSEDHLLPGEDSYQVKLDSGTIANSMYSSGLIAFAVAGGRRGERDEVSAGDLLSSSEVKNGLLLSAEILIRCDGESSG